jgi:ABC-type dipeptide/oligopeptide/nickel transport system ATPase component
MSDPVLAIEDLRMGVDAGGETHSLVHGVSLSIDRGERVALVGESGSGKSLTALAVVGLNAPPTRVTGGSIRLAGEELVGAGDEKMRHVRGARAAMVYQDPLSSLNPVRTIGWQVAEAITLHVSMGKAALRARVVELLDAVGLPEPTRQVDAYPHELSGGMRQRVVIAMAIAAGPQLLLADEPTTALDVTTQARILDLLVRLSDELHMAVLLITHDLGVAAGFSHRVNVMRAGLIVEHGPVEDIFRLPQHRYTQGLLDSICTLDLDPSVAMKVMPDDLRVEAPVEASA